MPNHSLDDVTIDGFRGLRNLRLDGLGWMNILVGTNNSGKTSVLEALSILCRPLQPLEWMAMVRRRDFGRLDETCIQSLRWCFHQSGELANPDAVFEAECRMSTIGTYPLRKLTTNYRDIIGEPTQDEFQRYSVNPFLNSVNPSLDMPTWAQLTTLLKNYRLENHRGAELAQHMEAEDSLQDPGHKKSESVTIRVWEWASGYAEPGLPSLLSLPVETLTPYSYQINERQVRMHSRHVFDSRKEIVLELVRDFDPDIEAIELASFRGFRPALYLKHKRLGPAPLSIFGDALRRAVLLASTLPTLENGGLLLIDEVETGIHVSALGRVFDWLRRWALQLKVQVVATTHSLEALDAIAFSGTDNPGDLVTYHLDQAEQETRAKRIDGELLLRLRRERGLDVR